MIKYPLQADNIQKIYNGKTVVDLSLKLNKAEVLGLIGKNGSGKSTTLNILAGVIHPDKGTVYINNQADIAKNFKLKQNIAYLPEEREEIENLTVGEYLNYIAQVYNKEKTEITGILTKVDAEHTFNQKFSELSKGYQQRILFASVLLADTPIMILDEMTDGLDPVQRKEFYSIINKIKHEKSIIISSHNMQEIKQICDRICIIDEGKIVKQLNNEDFEDFSDILDLNIKG
jgi:ABC-2 type transport system ATP-binding protein